MVVMVRIRQLLGWLGRLASAVVVPILLFTLFQVSGTVGIALGEFDWTHTFHLNTDRLDNQAGAAALGELSDHIRMAYPPGTVVVEDVAPASLGPDEREKCGATPARLQVTHTATILASAAVSDRDVFPDLGMLDLYECAGMRVRYVPIGAAASTPWAIAANAAVPLLALGLIVRARRRQPAPSRWADWHVRWGWRKSLAWGAGVGLALYFLVVGINALFWLAGSEWDLPQMPVQQIGLYLVLSVLIAPFFEEYVFRALLLEQVSRLMPPVLALLYSSALFTAIHFTQHAVFTVGVFVVGLGLGVLWLRSRSLLACTVAHAVFNLVVFSVAYRFLPA